MDNQTTDKPELSELPVSQNQPETKPPHHIRHGHKFIYGYLILVVLAFISGLSWHIYHERNDAAKNTAQQKSTSSTKITQPVTQYLTMKEWGVKIPLSSTISDAYYVVPTGISPDADGLPSGVIFGLKLLNSSCGTVSADPTGYNNDVGSIVRALPTDSDPVSGKTYTQLYPNGVTINGYYYGYSSGTTTKKCANTTTLRSINSAFTIAVKNMVSVGPSWQLYTSATGGFSFLHPANWSVTEGTIGNVDEDEIEIQPSNSSTNSVNAFRMTLWVSSNQDSSYQPNAIPNGTAQKLTNAFNVWTSNPQTSNRIEGNSTMACPVMELVNPSSTHFSNLLPNGKYVALSAGYCMGQKDTTTLSYQQLVSSQDWQTGIAIVQWIQWTQ